MTESIAVFVTPLTTGVIEEYQSSVIKVQEIAFRELD